MPDTRVSRTIPLEQLVGPSNDVRTGRPEEDVKSLASSMDRPGVGQIQDILVHPVDYDDIDQEIDEEWIDEHLNAGYKFRVVDGETRRQAAERLGWHSMHATVVPEPPEDDVVAKLDANTERVDMTDYEVAKALKEYYEETEATLDEVGKKMGVSGSRMSQVFSVLDAPEEITERWKHPDHPMTLAYAMSLRQILGENTEEKYREAGDLDRDEARELQERDLQQMIGVLEEHEPKVKDFRQRVKRRIKGTVDQIESDKSWTDKTAEGKAQTAHKRSNEPATPDRDPCTICGQERSHDTVKAIDACSSCYGLLTDLEERGETLVKGGTPQERVSLEDQEDLPPKERAAQALSEAIPELTPEEAMQGIASMEQQIQAAEGG
jgi:ParB/RepB/Spo0J family partition protein